MRNASVVLLAEIATGEPVVTLPVPFGVRVTLMLVSDPAAANDGLAVVTAPEIFR
jgi:hypothetical protein